MEGNGGLQEEGGTSWQLQVVGGNTPGMGHNPPPCATCRYWRCMHTVPIGNPTSLPTWVLGGFPGQGGQAPRVKPLPLLNDLRVRLHNIQVAFIARLSSCNAWGAWIACCTASHGTPAGSAQLAHQVQHACQPAAAPHPRRTAAAAPHPRCTAAPRQLAWLMSPKMLWNSRWIWPRSPCKHEGEWCDASSRIHAPMQAASTPARRGMGAAGFEPSQAACAARSQRTARPRSM